ncbi:MAG: S1/P1 nuclease [Armatimonadota bacterium]
MLMNIRIKKNVILFSLFLISIPSICFSWGAKPHYLITEHAVSLLPEDLAKFYDRNLAYIKTFSMLPDDLRLSYRETGYRHFIDLDMLDEYPFDKVKVDYKTAQEIFGEELLKKAGILPWAIEDHYNRLVKAMKDEDLVGVGVQSGIISHLVGDVHVPFHNTKNYDGATEDQKGIHFRWEEALVSMYIEPHHILPKEPEKVDKILDSAFNWSIESFKRNEAIFAADDLATQQDKKRGWKYYNVLWNETKDIMKAQLAKASERLAGVYIAAWEEAGKPDLGDKPAPYFWDMYE